MSVCAIIAAAGCGERMGGLTPKQFLEIKHKPILAHTLEKFCQCGLIDRIIIVAPKDWHQYIIENIIEKYSILKVNTIVSGGATRQESVYSALEAVNEEATTVVIHDAARPVVALNLLHKVINKGKETGAAVLAVPVHESLKKVSRKQVAYSLSRDSVWRVQTRRVFKKDLILNAYQQAFFNCRTANDDSELVEYPGYPIHVVAGSRTNIKITTPEDLKLAEILLKQLR